MIKMTPTEYRDLLALISVLGNSEAQYAAQHYTLRALVNVTQGRSALGRPDS
jgi:hypothetical protein